MCSPFSSASLSSRWQQSLDFGAGCHHVSFKPLDSAPEFNVGPRFSLRRAALRLLSSPSVSIASKPRTYASFAQPSIRPSRYPLVAQFQRRWASDETATRKEGEGEVPISHLQPSAQEEVEDAIARDNASDHAPDSAAAQNVSMADAAAAQAPGHSQEAVAEQEEEEEPTPSVMAPIHGSNDPTRRMRERVPATPKPTIFVGNLFFDVVENDLEKEFTRFGRIQSLRIIRDSRGLSKG